MSQKQASSRLAARYIDADLVVSDTQVWTYMRLPVVPYEFLAYDKRTDLAERIFLALSALVTGTESVDVHLLITNRPVPTRVWANDLDQRVQGWNPAPGWRAYAGKMAAYLEEQEFLQKEVYLGVCLGFRKSITSGAGALDLLGPLKKILGKTENALALEDDVVPAKDLDRFRQKAREVRRSLAQSHINATPIDANTVAWLIRKPLYPAMDCPPPSVVQSTPWGPGEVQTLTDGYILNGHKMLEIHQTGDDGIREEGFSATLALSRFPDSMQFPDQEPWIHFASSLVFPIDFSSRMTLVPPTQVRKEVGRKLAGVRDQADHIAQTGSAVPLDLQEQYQRATALEYTITKDRIPWAYGRHRINVQADTREELVARCKRVIEHYRDLGIDVVWPTGDQFDLLRESQPGDRVRCSSYFQRQELLLVAGGMPTASSEVGDQREGTRGWIGPYIGETTSRVRSQVNYSPHVAPIRNRPPGVAITGAPGGGKALACDTPIPTPTGWTTMGELKVGDEVLDENGKPCKVDAIFEQPADRPANEVVFDDGSVIVADDDHLWVTETRSSRASEARSKTVRQRDVSQAKQAAVRKYMASHDMDASMTVKALSRQVSGGPSEIVYYAAAKALADSGYKPFIEWRGNRSRSYYRVGTLLDAVLTRMSTPLNDQRHKRAVPKVRTTSEIRQSLTVESGARLNHSIPVTAPLVLPEADLPVDPYLLGVWLGDGHTNSAAITTMDEEVVWAFEDAGFPMNLRQSTAEKSTPGYGIGGGFKDRLIAAGVLGAKHVPAAYLRASEDQRRALLAGLIDSDGTIAADGQVQFTVTLEHLARSFRELALSLGFKATIRQRRAVMTLTDGSRQDCGDAWVVAFTSTEKVARLHRKAVRTHASGRPVTRRRYIKEVRPVESVPMRCISVTSHSRLFLAGEAMIATHNSFLAFTLAYQMAVQGVWTIYIDPKADAKPMAQIQGLGKPRMFDLRDGHDGMLDPFALADDRSAATLQAMETLRLLLGGNMSEEREEALLLAVSQVSEEAEPSLLKVVDRLMATESAAASALGLMLRTISQMPFARLCFAPMTSTPIRPQDGLTVITLLGLDLPNAEMAPADYSYENRLAVAVMYLLTRFARGLMLSMDKSHPKAICIDEAWAVTSTPQGAKLIPEIARMGRSHNTVPVLVSQNAGDLMADAVTNSLSTLFAFRSDRSGEISAILDLFNMEDNEGHRRAIRELRNGECLMKDLDGRIARVQIDAWNSELFEAFNTNPETRGESAGAA